MKWRGRTRLQGPRAPRPGPVGQVARLSETPVAFARSCLCGIETTIAFAGEKWAFLVQFVGAEVMAVSTLAVQGRAVVMMVSRWSASAVAEVSLVSAVPCCGCAEVMPVSMSPYCRASCATFVALLALMRVRARKSSPCGTVVIV